MTTTSFRSFLTWNMMLAVTAVIAFWTYYHGLDAQSADNMTSASASAASANLHGWLDSFRQTGMHYWGISTDWRTQIYNGLTQPK
jgi:hypothetical protein